jgi:hypothetical protein
VFDVEETFYDLIRTPKCLLRGWTESMHELLARLADDVKGVKRSCARRTPHPQALANSAAMETVRASGEARVDASTGGSEPPPDDSVSNSKRPLAAVTEDEVEEEDEPDGVEGDAASAATATPASDPSREVSGEQLATGESETGGSNEDTTTLQRPCLVRKTKRRCVRPALSDEDSEGEEEDEDNSQSTQVDWVQYAMLARAIVAEKPHKVTPRREGWSRDPRRD